MLRNAGFKVSLWVGFFGEINEDRSVILAFLAEMRELRASENAGWTGRHAVGEWNPVGQCIPKQHHER